MGTEVGEFGVKIYNVQWTKEVGGDKEMEEERETFAKTPNDSRDSVCVLLWLCCRHKYMEEYGGV